MLDKLLKTVRIVDLNEAGVSDFKKQFSGCIVLTQDNKILLQQRGDDFITFPCMLCEFGGRIEKGEEPVEAILRELDEELGAKVKVDELVFLGNVTESISNYTDLLFNFFWHDKSGAITGCYEGAPRYFNTVEEALNQPKIMDNVAWSLIECQKRKLL